jgi:hypothetical protein
MNTKNPSLKQTLKLLLNSPHGKFEQAIRDCIMKVFEIDDKKIDKYYTQGRVASEVILNNGQSMIYIDNDLKHRSRVKDPAILGSFVFAYARQVMNEVLERVNGFNDWDATFAYTDTDCYHLHSQQYLQLKKMYPELFGNDMGQFHDDIDEVHDGKVIRAIWISPKLYILEVIGK